MALFITLFLGLFIIAGFLIIRLCKNVTVIEHISLSIACGAMIALMLFDLIPEIAEEYAFSHPFSTVLWVAWGFLSLKFLDGFVPEHGIHEEASEHELMHIGLMSAIAIILHNILEGMTVYSMSFMSLSTGISLCIGIGAHNIPMGMLLYAMLKNEKKGLKITILATATLSTFIGGLILAVLHTTDYGVALSTMLCITLGMLLYIVFLEFIPSIRIFKNKRLSIICLGVGFILVGLSCFL